MNKQVGQNLRRVMAERGFSLQDVVAKTGLDRRTVLGMLQGRSKAHTRTLHRLAGGLGVPVAELFVPSTHALRRQFDVQTNPAVEEAIEAHPELVADWAEVDFEELYSRFGTGGPMTPEAALATVHEMNRRRQLQDKLALLLESHHAELVRGIIELLYREIAEPDR